SFARGFTSASAKSRTLFCRSCCSSVSSRFKMEFLVCRSLKQNMNTNSRLRSANKKGERRRNNNQFSTSLWEWQQATRKQPNRSEEAAHKRGNRQSPHRGYQRDRT